MLKDESKERSELFVSSSGQGGVDQNHQSNYSGQSGQDSNQNQFSYLKADIATIDYQGEEREIKKNIGSVVGGIEGIKKSVLHQKQLYPSEFYIYEVDILSNICIIFSFKI